MVRNLPFVALPLLAAGLGLVVAPDLPGRPPGFPWRPATLGTVGLNDPFDSVYALNTDLTWVGLPNNRGARASSASAWYRTSTITSAPGRGTRGFLP
jgi:hypothetical protein